MSEDEARRHERILTDELPDLAAARWVATHLGASDDGEAILLAQAVITRRTAEKAVAHNARLRQLLRDSREALALMLTAFPDLRAWDEASVVAQWKPIRRAQLLYNQLCVESLDDSTTTR